MQNEMIYNFEINKKKYFTGNGNGNASGNSTVRNVRFADEQNGSATSSTSSSAASTSGGSGKKIEIIHRLFLVIAHYVLRVLKTCL